MSGDSDFRRPIVGTKLLAVDEEVRSEVQRAGLVVYCPDHDQAVRRRAQARYQVHLDHPFDEKHHGDAALVAQKNRLEDQRDKLDQLLEEARREHQQRADQHAEARQGLTRWQLTVVAFLVLGFGLVAAIAAGTLLFNSLISVVEEQLARAFDATVDFSGLSMAVSALVAYAAAAVVAMGLGFITLATRGHAPWWAKLMTIIIDLVFSGGVAWNASGSDSALGVLPLALVEVSILMAANLAAYTAGVYMAPRDEQAKYRSSLARRLKAAGAIVAELCSRQDQVARELGAVISELRHRERAAELSRRVLDLAAQEAHCALITEIANEISKAAEEPSPILVTQAVNDYLGVIGELPRRREGSTQ